MAGTRSHATSPTYAPGQSFDVDDVILNYDPEFPQPRFTTLGLEAATLGASERLPAVVPWPDGAAPTAAPLPEEPAADADLSKFNGYDALVITWTAAEAAALAALFTPDYLPSRWYEYRHGAESYVKLVTGPKAPFSDSAPTMERYYHSLGLYFPCRIGQARVLLFKSGLHLDYDGPHLPLRKLVGELLDVINPKMLITTGTGGGVGADVALGDVIIAGRTRFDCTQQFASEPFHHASYNTSPLPAGTLQAVTPALTRVNAGRIVGGRAVPKIWAAADDAIVTTDFFGFDDSSDHYKLQGKGRVCDMGDAMVGQVASARHGLRWYAIRNASDPQMPNPDNDIGAANQAAARIYTRYGPFTTAASAIATWAVVHCAFNASEAPGDSHDKSTTTTADAKRADVKRIDVKRTDVKRTDATARTFHLGKKPAVLDSRTLSFGAYLTAALPEPPASVDWSRHVTQWPMYDNDRYGDCTCAAAGHMVQAWTAAGGHERTPAEATVLAFYEHFTPPGPENGCDMLSVLRYWQSHGLGTDKIGAYAQLEPHNTTQVKDAVNLLGGCYIGVELPKFVTAALQQGKDVPWVLAPEGTAGQGAPDPDGGHCIPAVGYDARNVYVVTWGEVKPMSWQFYTAYADEAFALLSADFLARGKSPAGFDLKQLQLDLAAIHGVTADRAVIRHRTA